MTRSGKILFLYALALLAGFALTGQYLQRVLTPGYGEDALHRMMARANHLYILFIALAILGSAVIENPSENRPVKALMDLGRILLVSASLLLVAAFFREHSGSIHDRSLTFYGCISALAGGLLSASKVFTIWESGNR